MIEELLDKLVTMIYVCGLMQNIRWCVPVEARKRVGLESLLVNRMGKHNEQYDELVNNDRQW